MQWLDIIHRLFGTLPTSLDVELPTVPIKQFSNTTMFANIVLLVIGLTDYMSLMNKEHLAPVAQITVTMDYAPMVASMKISIVTVKI